MLKQIHYGEYYPSIVNTPGRIKYDFPEEYLSSFEFEGDIECPDECSIVEITEEAIRRSIPHTQRRFLDYRCLLILKGAGDEVYYKIALQNKTDQTIAIITTTNSNDNLTRRGIRDGVKTLDGTWVMPRYRTTAPLYFWFELHKRLSLKKGGWC